MQLGVSFLVLLLQKLAANFVETWCYDVAYQWEELIKFWWWFSPGYGFWTSFIIAEYGILGDQLEFFIQSRKSAKWLMPARKWVHCFLADTQMRYWSVWKLRFESQITFGWGTQSSRGQMHLALVEVHTLWVLSCWHCADAHRRTSVWDKTGTLWVF